MEHEEFVDRDFELKVRDTAYFLWEQSGRPWGKEKEFWFLSLEKCLREHNADKWLRDGPDATEDANPPPTTN